MKKVLYVAFLALAVLALVAPPAMAQEEKPFKVHGEVRIRGEYNSNVTDFNDNNSDNVDFWPYRVRVSVEGSFAHNVASYVEIQNADVGGGNGNGFFSNSGPFRTGGGQDNNVGVGSGVELYQGNITLNQLWSKNFSLRIGRQEIVAGNELLLGDLDFYNGISHDGVVGSWNLKKVNLMLWATRPSQTGLNNVGLFGPTSHSYSGNNAGTENFWGGYATWTWKKDHTFDVYGMDLDDKQNFNVETVGVRYAHDVPTKNSFYWNIEVAQQFGDASYAGGSSITPFANSKAKGRVIEGWFGYTFRVKKNIHRIYGRYEMATGDDTSNADFQGFVPMFGDFHNRTGRGDWFLLADATSGFNGLTTGGIKAYSVGYNGFYNDRHEFGAAFWKYKSQQANGGNDDLGSAVDIWYGFNYSKNVTFSASLSQLNPGDGLTGGGANPNDPVKRLYGQARLRF